MHKCRVLSHCEIMCFQLGWGPGIPDLSIVSLDITARNYTVKNLSPNREYVFSLRAHNNHGPGFPIYESTVTSSEESSDLPTDVDFSTSLATPVEVRAETKSSNSILVSC